jgi:sugar phosphate isomerase/epimerase
MTIGIFAKTFTQPSLEGILDRVYGHALTQVQFNMSCAGLASMPDYIDPAIAKKIYKETYKRNIQIAAVSGTFNMIHPDVKERETGLKKLCALAAACDAMETCIVTLCTGSRNPDNMWQFHPENNTSSAWNDLLEIMEKALQIAEEYEVILAFEPEPANVVANAQKGKKLLDEMRSKYLKVVMDAANLFQPGNVHAMRETMKEAFDLLGNDIVLAHAKDIQVKNNELEVVAAGKGILDYDVYVELLQEYSFNGALILHGLQEDEVETSIQFLERKLLHLN